MTGPSSSRGKGIVTGSKNTESGKSHWDSLPYAAGVYINGSSNISQDITPNVDTESESPWASSKSTNTISGTTDTASSDNSGNDQMRTF